MRIKKFNECFSSDQREEIELLYSLLVDLEHHQFEMEIELEYILATRKYPNHTELQKRFQKYQILVDIVKVTNRIGELNNQIFLYTGE